MQRLDKMLPLVDAKDVEDDEKIFGESYDSEEESVINDAASEIEVKNYGSEEEDESLLEVPQKENEGGE